MDDISLIFCVLARTFTRENLYHFEINCTLNKPLRTSQSVYEQGRTAIGCLAKTMRKYDGLCCAYEIYNKGDPNYN